MLQTINTFKHLKEVLVLYYKYNDKQHKLTTGVINVIEATCDWDRNHVLAVLLQLLPFPVSHTHAVVYHL